MSVSISKQVKNYYKDLETCKKQFSKYFTVGDYHLKVLIARKTLTLEMDVEGMSRPRMKLKDVEFLYPVGSDYVKMFRAKFSRFKDIVTIKVATLIMTDPKSYYPFMSCLKEAILLSSKDLPEHVLSSKGYFLTRRRTYKFWEIEIDLVIMYADHDLTLLDLIRARSMNNQPWDINKIDTFINSFKQMFTILQSSINCKIFYPNPLNIVYSKAKDKFLLCNLQNSYLEKEIAEIKKKVENIDPEVPNIFSPNLEIAKIFPEFKKLYLSKNTDSFNLETIEYSLSIVSLQILEIYLSKNDKQAHKDLQSLLAQKTSEEKIDQNLLRKSINKSQIGNKLADKLRASLSNAQSKKEKLFSNNDGRELLESEEPIPKNPSEIKIINFWKNKLRNLEPDYNYMKEFYQARIFLLWGNPKKAVMGVRKSIQDYTKVEKPELVKWVSLLRFLINCLKKINLRKEAKEYSRALIKCINEGFNSKEFHPIWGKLEILSLRSILEPPQKLLDSRKDWGLPESIESCFCFYLYTLMLEDPQRLYQELIPFSKDNVLEHCRYLNYKLVVELCVLSNHSTKKEFINFIQAEKLGQTKSLCYFNNLGIVGFCSGDKQVFNKSFLNFKKIFENLTENKNSKKLKFTVEILNNFAVMILEKSGGSQSERKQALKYFNAALNYINRIINTTHRSELSVLNNIAILECLNGNYPEAKETIMNLYKKIKHESQKKPVYLLNLAKILHKNNDLNQANKILQKINMLLRSNQQNVYFDTKILRKIYLLTALNNFKLKRYDEALEYLSYFKDLVDGGPENIVENARIDRIEGMIYIGMKDYRKASKILE